MNEKLEIYECKMTMMMMMMIMEKLTMFALSYGLIMKEAMKLHVRQVNRHLSVIIREKEFKQNTSEFQHL